MPILRGSRSYISLSSRDFCSASDDQFIVSSYTFLTHFTTTVSLFKSIISICDTFTLAALPYYEYVDLSQCVNVRVVHIGTIVFDQSSSTLRTMHMLLSALPSNSVEEIVLTCIPTMPGQVAQLEHFFWLELVASVQKRFPMLKKITIRMGFLRNSSSFWLDNDLHPYIEAWRKQLGQEALVSLDLIHWGIHRYWVSLTFTF